MNSKDMFSMMIDDLKTAVGGSAVALATKDAAKEGGKLSLSNVNRWAKTLNTIAGGVVIVYVITVIVAGFGIHYADKHAFAAVFSHMTAEEILDYQDRLISGRSAPLPKDNELSKCAAGGKDNQK